MEGKTLFDLKKGEIGIIKEFNDNELPSKLYEIGILPGTEVQIKYSGLFRDPICISFGKNNTKLAIRKREAKNILIK